MRHPDLAMWRLMSPMLDRALDIDRDERNALLAELRTAQPDVATALEEALHEHDRLARAGFLETPPATHPAVPPPLAGTIVGAYTLEKRLGAGGMGSVWLARRSDGRFEGAVAVKLLHVAVLDAGGAQRFTREGSFLARLSHPHIARLLDAGVTASGQPYLVLEHVEGVRIDEYADSRTLDLRARLNLFLQVADAVSHAHAHLIVHRDLKPGNILVDEHGQVKLLDFGIAKLVDGSGADDTVIGGRAWTPAYAAPEQVRDEPVTVATDVYALGVLLYDLLVEAHPTGTGCTDSGRVRARARGARSDRAQRRTHRPPHGCERRGTSRHHQTGPSPLAPRRSRQHRRQGPAEGAGAALRERGGVCRGYRALSA